MSRASRAAARWMACAQVLCTSAFSAAVELTAVNPPVTPINHAATVTLMLSRPAKIESVSLKPGGARAVQTIGLQMPVAQAAFGHQSLLIVSSDGSASIATTALPEGPKQALLPAGSIDIAARVAFDDQTLLAVSDGGEIVAGNVQDGRWIRSQISWDDSDTLKDVAVANQTGIIATGKSLLSIGLLDENEDGAARLLFEGGGVQAVAAAFPNVLVGLERGIRLLTIDASGKLTQQSDIPSRFTVKDVALSSHTAVVALGQDGIMLLDVTDTQQPLWLSRYSNIGDIQSVRIADTRLLAVNKDGRHFVFDLTNPSAPIVDHAWQQSTTQKERGLTETSAWLVSENSVTVWDIQSSGPRLSNANLDAGQGVNYGGQRKAFFDADTRRLYVADWFSGMHIYDAARPDRPRLLSTLHTPGSPKGVTVRNAIAYVADDDHGLQIVDVANPHRPQIVANLPLKGLAYTPVVEGNRLFMASHHGGFQVVDITEPTRPQLVGEYDTPGKAWSLALKGDVVIVADSEAGLIGYSIVDPTHPEPVWEFNPEDHAEDILVEGAMAYAAFFDGSVYTLDIADPFRPTVLGQVKTPGNARGLAKRGNTLHVANWLAGVVNVDVTDPQAPLLGDWLDTDGATWGVTRGDTAMFVLDWWGGLLVLGGAPEHGLKLTGKYNQFAPVNDLAVSDNYLLTAEGPHGMQIYDIKNQLNPTWAAGIEFDDAATRLAVANRRAYVALASNQIQEVDVADPFAPRIVGLLKASGAITQLKAAGNSVAYRVGSDELCVFTSSSFNTPRCHRLDSGVTDFDVHDNRVVAASANRVWRWRAEDFPEQVDTTFAIDGGAKFVRAGERDTWVVDAQGNIGRYNEETKEYEPGDGQGQLGRLNDLLREGDDAIMATDNDVRLVDARAGEVHGGSAYDAGRPITRLAYSKGVVYGASSQSIFAVSPLGSSSWSMAGDTEIRLDIPATLPEGNYDVELRVNGEVFVFANAIRRQLKGFGRAAVASEVLESSPP